MGHELDELERTVGWVKDKSSQIGFEERVELSPAWVLQQAAAAPNGTAPNLNSPAQNLEPKWLRNMPYDTTDYKLLPYVVVVPVQMPTYRNRNEVQGVMCHQQTRVRAVCTESGSNMIDYRRQPHTIHVKAHTIANTTEP